LAMRSRHHLPVSVGVANRYQFVPGTIHYYLHNFVRPWVQFRGLHFNSRRGACHGEGGLWLLS
ncbi:MAG: hypothetical protein WA728_05275, partial [Xanthobacteraceae bacterium]